jgi:hypothetical protein
MPRNCTDALHKVKADEMGRGCSTIGEKNEYRIVVGNPEGKRLLGIPRRRWVDKVKMDLKEIEWGSMDCIDLTQDWYQWRTLVNMVMNIRVP